MDELTQAPLAAAAATAEPQTNEALEAYIAKGRELASTALEPLDRLAQGTSPWSHEFATAASAVRAGFHALLSHVLHEDHPGVIAAAAEAAAPVVEDAEALAGEVVDGAPLSQDLSTGEALVGSAVSGAAEVAADVAAGTPIVSSEDVASAEATVADVVTGDPNVTPVPASTDPNASTSDAPLV